jgi:hypothetical protein
LVDQLLCACSQQLRQRIDNRVSTCQLNNVILTHSGVSPNGCFGVSQQQINQIRRFFSTAQTPDSVITQKNLIESYSVIKVSSKFVPMPNKLEVKRAAATELERFSEYVWVSFEKLSDYLESLGGMAHNKSPKPTQ